MKRWSPTREQFIDANGNPYSGGRLYWYAAGSTTAQDTFTDSTGATANANPVVCDSAGRPQTEVWLTTAKNYKLVFKTSADVTIFTEDNIAGINDATLVLDEWIAGPTPTYVSATSFTLVGDQTSTFLVGRRVKVTDSGGTKYGTIKVSAYTTLTTITLDSQDSDALATPTSAVSYGLFSPTNTSHPVFSDALAVVGGSADRSKRLRFEVDGLTTATTRVLTVQDSDDTLVGRATTDTLTNKTLTTPTLNGNLAGTSISSQADLEAASSTALIVTPGRQQFHPSAAKGWVRCGVAGDISASYNVTSVTDTATGQATVNWGTDFSSANYAAAATALSPSLAVFAQFQGTPAVGSILISSVSTAGALTDPVGAGAGYYCVAFGDQ